MTETHDALETRVQDLDERLRRMEERLAELETAPSHVVRRAAAPRLRHEALPPPAPEPRSYVALVGRALLAIGGAYFLRALTESHVLPQLAGLALGLAYAAVWIYVSARHCEHGDRISASFAAAVSSMIAFPLLWEGTARFHSFSPEIAALLLVAISTSYLFVAYRYSLGSAAWITSLASLFCTLALMLASEQVALLLVAFAIVSAALWHVAGQKSWKVVAWPPIAATTGLAIVLQLMVLAKRGVDSPSVAAVALLTIAVVFAAAVSAKTLLWRMPMSTADAVASAVIILTALAGGARIAAVTPELDGRYAAAILTLAIGSYVLSLRQPESFGTTMRYFGAIGLACTLIATAAAMTPSLAALTWIALAAASILAGSFMRRGSDYALHATVYAVAAAAASGLLSGSLSMISGIGKPPQFTPERLIVTLALAATALLAILLRSPEHKPQPRIACLTLMSIAAVVLIGTFAHTLLNVAHPDAAFAAATRSAIIAVSSVALAIIARSRRFADAAKLVYPILGLGAAKFIVDDFMTGRAATLFVTLAVYGCALLLLAKLRRTATV